MPGTPGLYFEEPPGCQIPRSPISMRWPMQLSSDLASAHPAVFARSAFPTPGIPGSGGPFGEIDPERPNLPFDGPHNSGADALPRARLGIAGMELTQSIQYSGAAGTTFGDDNSVPLVALKTSVARVYPVA